jgi:hypothetical protein
MMSNDRPTFVTERPPPEVAGAVAARDETRYFDGRLRSACGMAPIDSGSRATRQ